MIHQKRSHHATCLEVPAQKAAVAAARQHVQIVVENGHRVDACIVLLEVAHQLARPHLPDAHLAGHAAADDEFLGVKTCIVFVGGWWVMVAVEQELYELQKHEYLNTTQKWQL